MKEVITCYYVTCYYKNFRVFSPTSVLFFFYKKLIFFLQTLKEFKKHISCKNNGTGNCCRCSIEKDVLKEILRIDSVERFRLHTEH